MAKCLLWFMVIFAFILIAVEYTNGVHTQLFTKILFWSGIAVLAICETIEKVSKRK